MSDFQWDSSLDVGVDAMNDQHKRIIDLINVVSQDVDAGRDPLANFDSLASYVVEHFSQEEAYMEKHAYSGIASHKLMHAKLLARVGEFRDSMVAGKLDTAELFAFLRMWLKSHIKGIDTKYAAECAGFTPAG